MRARGRTTPRTLTAGLIVAVLGTACMAELDDGGGPLAPTDPLAGLAQSQNEITEQIALTRMAIYKGRGLGEELLTRSVNQVLRQDLVPYQLTGLDELPAPAQPASCPYVEALGNDPTTAVSCRYVVERGRDLAYGEVGAALADNPLGADFEAAADPTWVLSWYRKGTFSGVDGQVLRAAAELRAAGVCDASPTPVQSSELAGREVGRALFQRLLEQQVANTPRTVCDIDGGIVAPARTAALAAVADELAARPLCPEGIGTSETDALLAFADARLSYELGVRAGIEAEAVIQSQRLLDTWVCEPPPPPQAPVAPTGGYGDPLVVDVAGDGIAAPTLASGVAFDLTGTGLARRVAWPAADDALVAIDLDGSGAIESGRELLGNYGVGPGDAAFGDGFQALAAWDHEALGGNGDGVIDAADAVFGRLLLWRDADRDGRSQAAELAPLGAVLDRIPLAAEPVGVRAGDAVIASRSGRVYELWVDARF